VEIRSISAHRGGPKQWVRLRVPSVGGRVAPVAVPLSPEAPGVARRLIPPGGRAGRAKRPARSQSPSWVDPLDTALQILDRESPVESCVEMRLLGSAVGHRRWENRLTGLRSCSVGGISRPSQAVPDVVEAVRVVLQPLPAEHHLVAFQVRAQVCEDFDVDLG